MEDKRLNEKESLELIAQMIQNTRRNLDSGSGVLGLTCMMFVLLATVYGRFEV